MLSRPAVEIAPLPTLTTAMLLTWARAAGANISVEQDAEVSQCFDGIVESTKTASPDSAALDDAMVEEEEADEWRRRTTVAAAADQSGASTEEPHKKRVRS